MYIFKVRDLSFVELIDFFDEIISFQEREKSKINNYNFCLILIRENDT
jgi:hypothetical protein